VRRPRPRGGDGRSAAAWITAPISDVVDRSRFDAAIDSYVDGGSNPGRPRRRTKAGPVRRRRNAPLRSPYQAALDQEERAGNCYESTLRDRSRILETNGLTELED